MLFVRVDGNSHIGMGHIMRTMSIVQYLEKENVFFLTSDEQSLEVIKNRGYSGKTLNKKAFSYEEAICIKQLLSGRKDDSIIIDSYLFDNTYLDVLKDKAYVICMDDLIEEVFRADAIINYNSYANLEEYNRLYEEEDTKPEFIIGSKFIPLREEFSNISYKVREKVRNILITTGGGDVNNYAGQILNALLKAKEIDERVSFDLVCGKFNPHYDEINKLASINSRVKVFQNVNNMSELMAANDICISASGSTCYELCAVGIPFVCFGYADNQKRILKDLDDKGISLAAGMITDSVSKEKVINAIVQNILKLYSNYEFRVQLNTAEKELVKGDGARMIAESLKELRRV